MRQPVKKSGAACLRTVSRRLWEGGLGPVEGTGGLQKEDSQKRVGEVLLCETKTAVRAAPEHLG